MIAKLLAAALLGGAGPVLAFDPGDGSSTSNFDHVVPGGCPPCATAIAPPEVNPLLSTWSLGLRGSYSSGTNGDNYKVIALPSAGLTFAGARHGYAITGSAEVSVGKETPAQLDSLSGLVQGSYRLDESTGFSGTLQLEAGQSSSSAGWPNAGVAVPSQAVTGSGEGALSRDIGPFTFTARGFGERTLNGPETLADQTVLDMVHKDYWSAGAGLRTSYALGPIVSVFADLSAARQMFDVPSPYLLVKQDNDTYAATLGVRVARGEQLELEAAAGLESRKFAEPGLGEVRSGVASASVTWRPSQTLTLSATASYGLAAETVTGSETTPQEAALTGDARYVVNPWLTLRGSLGWSQTTRIGSVFKETRYQAGVGADYAINPRAKFTADYSVNYRELQPNPPEHEHRASVGVTFSK